MNELVRRSYGFSVRAMKEEERAIEVVASSEAIDAYGEVVVQDWDLTRYKANPVVLYGHNSWGLPIGHASDVRVDDGKLLAKLHFVDARANPQAELVWQGILQGSLRAVSVGFRPKAAKSQTLGDRTVFVLSGNELIEISVVPIPANPEAVAVSAKSMDLIRALAAQNDEDPAMSLYLKTLLPILCLAATANDDEIVSEVTRLKALERDVLGATEKKSAAEALGVVQGWKAAAGQVEELRGKVTAMEKAAEDRERSSLIEKARNEGKIAPALLDWAKSCPLDTLRAFVETAPAIPQFKASPEEPRHTPAELDWQGKKWGELSPSEKHDLYHQNHDLYVAMRDAAKRAA